MALSTYGKSSMKSALPNRHDQEEVIATQAPSSVATSKTAKNTVTSGVKSEQSTMNRTIDDSEGEMINMKAPENTMFITATTLNDYDVPKPTVTTSVASQPVIAKTDAERILQLEGQLSAAKLDLIEKDRLIASYEERITTLNAMLEQSSQQNVSLDGSGEIINTGMDQGLTSHIESELEAVSEQLRIAKRENNQLVEDVRTNQKRAEKQQAEICEHLKEIDRLRKVTAEKHDQCERLDSRLQEQQRNVPSDGEFQKKIVELTTEITRLQQNEENFKKRAVKNEALIESQNGQIARMNDKLERLQSEEKEVKQIDVDMNDQVQDDFERNSTFSNRSTSSACAKEFQLSRRVQTRYQEHMKDYMMLKMQGKKLECDQAETGFVYSILNLTEMKAPQFPYGPFRNRYE